MSLVGQWVSEAKSKLTDNAALKIYEYYGSNRIRDSKKLAEYDLVVTTFETLASDYCRGFETPKDRAGNHYTLLHFFPMRND